MIDIEKMEAAALTAIDEMDVVPEWISVEKQLPVLHKGYSADCLVITNFGNRLISRYDSYSKSWSLYQCEDHSVTHWMPLPTAPEGWRCPVYNTDPKAEHAYDCLAAARSEK